VANAKRYKGLFAGSHTEVISGVLQLNSGADPTVLAGVGFTATSDTSGQIQVTPDDTYPAQTAVVLCGLEVAATNSTDAVYVLSQDVSSPYVRFITQSADGTEADLDGINLHFAIIVKNEG